MSAERVALITPCAECRQLWLPATRNAGRRAGGGDSLDEPAELVLLCPRCSEVEFGDQ